VEWKPGVCVCVCIAASAEIRKGERRGQAEARHACVSENPELLESAAEKMLAMLAGGRAGVETDEVVRVGLRPLGRWLVCTFASPCCW